MQCSLCGAPYTWQGSMSSGGLRPSCACAHLAKQATIDDGTSGEVKRPILGDPRIVPPPPPMPDPGQQVYRDPSWDDPDYVWRQYACGNLGATEAYQHLERIRQNPKALGAKDTASKRIRGIMEAEYLNPKHDGRVPRAGYSLIHVHILMDCYFKGHLSGSEVVDALVQVQVDALDLTTKHIATENMNRIIRWETSNANPCRARP